MSAINGRLTSRVDSGAAAQLVLQCETQESGGSLLKE